MGKGQISQHSIWFRHSDPGRTWEISKQVMLGFIKQNQYFIGGLGVGAFCAPPPPPLSPFVDYCPRDSHIKLT